MQERGHGDLGSGGTMATTDGGTTGDGDADARYIDATTGSEPSSARRAWLLAAGTVVAIVVVIGLVAVTRSPADESTSPTTTAPSPDDGRDDTTESGVAAPYDGKASMRLPITVSPNRDLVDGQVVTVSGTGFPPGADIGVIMCTNEAVFDGIAACDIATAMSSISMTNQAITADGDGSFSVPYRVRFRFSVADPDAPAPPPPGTVVDGSGNVGVIYPNASPAMRQIDCGAGDIDPDVWPTVIPPTAESDPGGFTCIIAAGMISDYDQSGGAAIGAVGAQFRTFGPDETHARPTVAPVEPDPSTTTSLVGSLPTTSRPPAIPPPGPISTTTTAPPPDPPEPPLEPGSTTTTGPP